MQHFPKIGRSILATMLFISFALTSSAQYPGMAAVRANMNTQFMNQQMNMQMQMNMLNNNGSYNFKYTYHVTLANDSVLLVNSRIYSDTSRKKTYLLIVDKRFKRTDSAHRFRRIYPNQTKSIFRVDSNVVVADPVTIKGIVTDSCWMFKVMTGPISLYSFVSDELEGNVYPPICGVQQNDGPIVKYTRENLKQMMVKDPKAMEIVEGNNWLRAIKRYNRDFEKTSKNTSGSE